MPTSLNPLYLSKLRPIFSPGFLSIMKLLGLISFGLAGFAYGSSELYQDDRKASLLWAPLRGLSGMGDFLRQADPRDNVGVYSLILSTTAATLVLDQKLVDAAQKGSKRIGLIGKGDDGRQTRVVFNPKIGALNFALHIPRSPNTYMYYLGDGLTSVLIMSGVLSYSAISGDQKSWHVASQFLESLVLTGSFIIPLKMASGRESPFRASQRGGKWRGFVGFKHYFGDVSKHDAYPSGHIATLMTTTRIFAENYPTKSWIYPLGITGMSLLGFAMLNNGVHWASDLPLGIAVGYNAAGVVLTRHGVSEADPKESRLKPQWHPYVEQGGVRGLKLSWDLL